MVDSKMLIAAAALAVASLAGGTAASADPWDAHRDRPVVVIRPIVAPVVMREEHAGRPIVLRERVFETLRLHRYRGIGEPYFVRGHYVVRVNDHFGRPVFVEVDPYTGAFIGEFRV